MWRDIKPNFIFSKFFRQPCCALVNQNIYFFSISTFLYFTCGLFSKIRYGLLNVREVYRLFYYR